jgi:hypothetical protein
MLLLHEAFCADEIRLFKIYFRDEETFQLGGMMTSIIFEYGEVKILTTRLNALGEPEGERVLSCDL